MYVATLNVAVRDVINQTPHRDAVVPMMTTMMMIVMMMIVIEVVIIVILLFADQELGRRDPRAQDAFGRDLVTVERQAAERASQVRERQAGVEKRAEDHVAGDPGETVEVEHA